MLRLTIASAFKSKGKQKMTMSELIYTLSLDLKWFSHEISKKVVERALDMGIITKENGDVVPAFDLNEISVPPNFKPDIRRVLSSSVFDEVVADIGFKTGKTVPEVIAEINQLQEKFNYMLEIEVVALILAKKHGIDIAPYLKRVKKSEEALATSDHA
jgi:hypothetical protein